MVMERLLGSCDQEYAIEIGGFFGSTTTRLASLCEKKGMTLVVIDPWIYQNSYFIFKQTTKGFDCIRTIKKTSKDAFPEVKSMVDGKCGFIFVDGNHSYPVVKFDMENYFSLLAKDGVLVAHDLWFSEGVKKAFYEFVKTRSFYTFKHEPTEDELINHHSAQMGLGWVHND
jgi:predicted O-methyltransferase YrrM